MRTLSQALVPAFLASVLVSALAPRVAHAEPSPIVKEVVVFLDDRAETVVRYETLRTSAASVAFGAPTGASLEEVLRNDLYIFPKNIQLDHSDPAMDWVTFPGSSSFGRFYRQPATTAVTRDASGIYTFTEHGSFVERAPEGHSLRTPFDHYAMGVVLPDHFEFVDGGLTCDQPGSWVRRGNTATFYGQRVNNLTVQVRFRPRILALYTAIAETASAHEVLVTHDTRAVTVSVFFASASARLGTETRAKLATLAQFLAATSDLRIAVQGGADMVPIHRDLTTLYRSNWELGAARSLAVLHHLIASGLPESAFEATSVGRERQVASNDTDQGRAQNRRVDITVSKHGLVTAAR